VYNAYGADFILHRPAFEKEWADHLRAMGVQFFQESVVEVKSNRCVTIGHQHTVSYRYLIDCSGRQSRFHQSARLIFDKMIGITFMHKAAGGTASRIYIESGATGWWYHSQSNNCSITTYFTDHDLYSGNIEDLRNALNKTTTMSSLNLLLVGKPVVQQCYTSILKTPPEQILQVGDAYYSLDPLSSQGIYKAIVQAQAMATLLVAGANSVALLQYYDTLAGEFSDTLRLRQHYYQQAHLYHKTEFYKRRILHEKVLQPY
jgi:flavin-dependent dehydrogenase